MIREWRVVGVFDSEGPEAHRREFLREAVGVAEDGITAASFSALNITRMASGGRVTTGSAGCAANGDYANLGELFRPIGRSTCYLGAIILSEVDQEATLFVRCAGPSPDGREIWLNGDEVFKEPRPERNYCAVRLKKGENFLLVRSDWSGESQWLLHVSLYNMARGRELFYLNDVESNFLESAVVDQGNTLTVRVNTAFAALTEPTTLVIRDAAGTEVMKKRVSQAKPWKVPLREVPCGVFSAELQNGKERRLRQSFIHGDRSEIFATLEARTRRWDGDPQPRINVESLLNRYRFLESFGSRNGFDHHLLRKLANVLFALDGDLFRLELGREGFSDVPGLHLRGFKSGLDGTIRSYLLYIPDSHDRRTTIPLVVSMPYIARSHNPFAQSVHVANLKRITMLCRLADERGFAILWPDARIYDRLNLHPVASASVFETVAEVARGYAIDSDRIYGYGSCTGGLFALLLANRYPGFFAAVGVDGPELGYADSQRYPEQWKRENNLFEMVENFTNTPLYVVHSRNDQKADHALSEKLVNLVNSHGGNAVLDEMGNPTKAQPIELLLEEEIMPRLFGFFAGKKRESPTKVALATSQLKYNRAFWLTVDRITPNRKALLTAEVRLSNTLHVTAENVAEYTVDVAAVPGLADAKRVKVYTNRTLSFDGPPADGKVTIGLGEVSGGAGVRKTSAIEGPIAHLLGAAFLVVRGTGGSEVEREAAAVAAEQLSTYWQKTNYGTCRLKTDIEVTNRDIRDYHIVLIGIPAADSLLAGVRKKLPLIVGAQGISIGERRYPGKDLGYVMIYPNSLNPSRYLMVLGSNNPAKSWIPTNIQYSGFHDYEIWNADGDDLIESGDFDEQWCLRSRSNRDEKRRATAPVSTNTTNFGRR